MSTKRALEEHVLVEASVRKRASQEPDDQHFANGVHDREVALDASPHMQENTLYDVNLHGSPLTKPSPVVSGEAPCFALLWVGCLVELPSVSLSRAWRRNATRAFFWRARPCSPLESTSLRDKLSSRVGW
jgi:hypothetical protein